MGTVCANVTYALGHAYTCVCVLLSLSPSPTLTHKHTNRESGLEVAETSFRSGNTQPAKPNFLTLGYVNGALALKFTDANSPEEKKERASVCG